MRIPEGNPVENSNFNILAVQTAKQSPSRVPPGTSVPSVQRLLQLSKTIEEDAGITPRRGPPSPKFAFPDLKNPPNERQERKAPRSSPQAQVNAATAALEYEKLEKIPEGMRTNKDKAIMRSLAFVINDAQFVKPGDFEALKQKISGR